MRSNGRNSGSGNRNSGGGSGGNRDNRGADGGRDDQPKRPSRPRPEERRYDVGRSGATGGSGASGAPGGSRRSGGPGGSGGGSGSGGSGGSSGGGARQGGGARGAAARGGAKGGPKPSQGGGGRGPRRGAPARPRELDAKIEQRNRDRYADKPAITTPRTNLGAEQEGERLQKVLARVRHGFAPRLRGADRAVPRRGQRRDRAGAGAARRPGAGRDQGRRADRRHPVVPLLRAEQAGRCRLHDGGPRR